MPRPVLSETTFNSSNIASAILEQADLSVTSEDLGVVDRSSVFTPDSNYSVIHKVMYSFNGFMFVSYQSYRTGTPAHQSGVMTITDSDFFPNQTYHVSTIGWQGDVAEHCSINTNGNINIHNPTNVSHEYYYVQFNCWYRFT
jgi:hypothetical protein